MLPENGACRFRDNGATRFLFALERRSRIFLPDCFLLYNLLVLCIRGGIMLVFHRRERNVDFNYRRILTRDFREVLRFETRLSQAIKSATVPAVRGGGFGLNSNDGFRGSLASNAG